MPVLRNIPVFPEGEVDRGEGWTHPAQEVHDFRDNFGVDQPYTFPLDVNYLYLGVEEREGLPLHAIRIRYTLFHTVRPSRGGSFPLSRANFRYFRTNPLLEFRGGTTGVFPREI